MIVGRADASASALRSLESSIAPLARVDPKTRQAVPTSVEHQDLGDDWDHVVEFMDAVVRTNGAGPRGSWIAQFPDVAHAEALCRSVIATSRLGERHGVVAALPVRLLSSPARRY
jgi:hypothetical protein